MSNCFLSVILIALIYGSQVDTEQCDNYSVIEMLAVNNTEETVLKSEFGYVLSLSNTVTITSLAISVLAIVFFLWKFLV